MITEDYVSFETAKLLKKKGFDEATIGYYYTISEIPEKIKFFDSPISIYDSEGLIGCIQAPTLQMAMKWLRKVHEIFIRPNISFLYPIKYYCEIFCYGDNLKTQQDVTTENFESPEEACEAAIKYCLENLI